MAARVRELTESRFREFEQQLLRGKAEAGRNAAFQKKRIKRRREFLSSMGTDLKKPLLNVEKQNAQEVDSFDRTLFLAYTAALRAGDPVVVAV